MNGCKDSAENEVFIFVEIDNKPETAQVGAISKAQKSKKVLKNTTPKHHSGRKFREILGKKSIMFYEKLKRNIRTLKLLHPNFENVISEL